MPLPPDPALPRPRHPPETLHHRLEAGTDVPNNERCPVIVYPGVMCLPEHDPARVFERIFRANAWSRSWRDGVYPYHHFHTTAHEVLGVYAGRAEVCLGGVHGLTLTIRAGDVLVVPAGVAHKRLDARPGLGVVGAYPDGQTPDLCRPDAAALEPFRERVRRVAMPVADPLYGDDGPLLSCWR